MDFAAAIAFYESALVTGTNAGAKVGWLSGERYQLANFAAICDVEVLDDGASVLDVGCGTGALLAYLTRVGRRVEYVGVDISEKMIDAARAAHPGGTFEVRDILVDPPSRRFDVVICSGTLNYRVPDHVRWMGDMIAKMYELADRAAVINFLNAAYTSGLHVQLADQSQFARVLPEDAVRFARMRCPDVRVSNTWASTFELVMMRPRTNRLSALARSLAITADSPSLEVVLEYAFRRRLYAELRDYLRTLEPTALVLEGLANALLRLGEKDEAVALLERVAAMAPARPTACIVLGRFHFESKRDNEAQRWLREALVRDPDDPDSRYGLVVSLVRSGQRDAARVVALEAPEGALRELLDAITSSTAPDAIAGYKRALALAPRLLEPLCVLANVAESRGAWTEALELWTRAYEIAPDDPSIRERLQRARR